jgi:thiol-disulfide isomerase/thioredoxin
MLLACFRPAPPAPDVRMVDLKGLEAALAEYRGKGVLLNFWAIWCEPCVAELPELMETARKYRERGGVVIGISYDFMVPDVTAEGVLKQVRAFVKERRFDIPIYIYQADDFDAINRRFALPGPIPATVAIDRYGSIVETHEGQAGKARFDAMMEKALLNPAPKAR